MIFRFIDIACITKILIIENFKKKLSQLKFQELVFFVFKNNFYDKSLVKSF